MRFHFLIFQHALWIVHFAIVFVFLGHIVRQRKAPASALAWFLFVLIAPYVGLPLYFTFGLRKFLPAKPLLFDLRVPSALFFSDSVQKTLVASGCPPPCLNSEIQLLDTGEKAFQCLTELIRGAKSSIYLETYILSDDEIGYQIVELLTAKAQNGLDVRILIDSVGARLPGHPSFSNFKSAGGRVAFFMPLLHRPFQGTFNLGNHRKLILVDREIAVVGGMNIGLEYMGSTPDPSRWTDLAVTLKGPVVGQFEVVFFADWNYAAGSSEKLLETKNIAQGGEHLSQMIVSGPDVATDPIYEFLLTTLYRARDRVWLSTPYFVPDDALAKAIELAGRRGVDVRLFLPKKSNHLLADWGRNTYVQQIVKACGRLFLYPHMLHAKVVLVDSSYALVSSANLDARSLLLNYELGLCLYSSADISNIEKWFIEVQKKCSEEIPKIKFAEMWASEIARMIGPLL